MEISAAPRALALSHVLLLLNCIAAPVSAEDPTLTLAVFVSAINTTGSFTGSADVGRPFVEAVGLAVEMVNNDTSLMPGYNLDYRITDSQVGEFCKLLGCLLHVSILYCVDYFIDRGYKQHLFSLIDRVGGMEKNFLFYGLFLYYPASGEREGLGMRLDRHT